MARPFRRTWWFEVVSAAAVLAALNVVNNLFVASARTAIGAVELVLLAILARALGLTLDDVGLSRPTWTRGLRWAAAAFGLVAIVYGMLLAVPSTRDAFLDRRADLDVGRALVGAVLTTLVGTVLLEEFAFRGLLWGLINRIGGPARATVGSSVLFGLWHVLPSRGLTRDNGAVAELLGPGPGVVATILAVLSAALAGVVLAELRRRTGSLLPPIGLHLATNSLGYIGSAIAWLTFG